MKSHQEPPGGKRSEHLLSLSIYWLVVSAFTALSRNDKYPILNMHAPRFAHVHGSSSNEGWSYSIVGGGELCCVAPKHGRLHLPPNSYSSPTSFVIHPAMLLIPPPALTTRRQS